MCTTSKCCSIAQVVTGVVVVAGVAAFTLAMLSRHAKRNLDPLVEADRRIDELEESLRHLQDSFCQAVGS
ncbi:MAG TPA: hypothetical protein VHV83_08845 [Armatimonadota bacterium]|nr:hypothetical protein [Armatimonadota bacterium]